MTFQSIDRAVLWILTPLAFAILVARLEDDLGIDPFTIAEDAAFPSTIGEFVRAYVNVPA